MSGERQRIVVLGDLMLDVVVRPDGAIKPTSDTPSSVRLTRGGAAANFAVALAQSGHDVTYVALVGDDLAANVALSALAQSGVATNVDIVDAPTGIVVALVAEDGQRAMLTERGANQLLTVERALRLSDLGAEHVHISGYTFLDPASRPAAKAVLARARERGVPVSVDVCSLEPLKKTTPEIFLGAVSGATMLFANEEESLALTDTRDVESALRFLEERFFEVVITLGAKGALCQIGKEGFRVPATAGLVLDTTGAGDAATGTYLGERLRGADAETALRAAMAAASVAVRSLGAVT